jgi:hypothetical protein
MYKELIFIKNNNGFWDYVFDISKSIHKNISTEEDIVNFVEIEFEDYSYSDILFWENEVYILLDNKLNTINPGEKEKN